MRATGPARGAGVDPAALASDLDEPVVVGAPSVGAAGADASPSNARSALGRRGRCWARMAPPTFKFGFRVVPREELSLRGHAMFEGACIRVCATQGCGLLELGLAACQCLRGHASECALR
jgi:hypothetical protein